MTADECCNELVLWRRRRELLSSSQRVAMDKHLRDCPSCRITSVFSDAFEDADSIPPDDTDRLDSMLDAANRWLEQPRSLTRIADQKRRVRVALIVAALSVATTAAAATFVVRSQFWRAPAQAEPRGTTTRLNRGNESSPVAPTVAETATSTKTVSSAAIAAVAAATPTLSPSRAQATTGARPVEESPAALLQRATEARRAGSITEASRLFQRLQLRHPASRESQLSQVVYGSMLLDQGQAGPALGQFQRYLSTSGGRNLSAEALYGKGRALAQLGRVAEEQATWRTLSEQFPKSPYVSHAQKRLGQSK